MKRTFVALLALSLAGGSLAAASVAQSAPPVQPRNAVGIGVDQLWAMQDDTTYWQGWTLTLNNSVTFSDDSIFTKPIGDDTTPFTSVFDGNSNSINNFRLTMSGSGEVKAGLFGVLGPGHVIKNLTLTGSVSATSSDNAPAVGGLAGKAVGGEISNVKVTTSVTAIAGGVASRPTAGGIVGTSIDDTITWAQVRAGSIVIASGGVPTAGGIVGSNVNTLLNQVTSAASVTSRYPTDANAPTVAGGLNGLLYGDGTLIRDSYASGSVTVDRQSGALAHAILGGIVGDAAGSPGSGVVDRTYSYGATQVIQFATPYSGALVGATSRVNLARSFHVSGVAGVGFLSAATQDDTGLDEAEQKQFASYAGTWPIVSTWQYPGANVWGICNGQSFPYLLWQVMADPCISTNTITGTPDVGQELASNADTFDDSLAYQWGTLSGSTFTPIAGADDSIYTVRTADAGTSLAVQVTNLKAPFDVTGMSTPVSIPAPPVPPQPPVFPPGAPIDVVATAEDASASVAWSPPSSPGTFPITSYRATASPGGASCLTSAPTCTIGGLANGTSYIVTVRALNGAGWGAESAPSNAITPRAEASKSVLITGSRGTVNGKPGVIVEGSTTDLVGATVTPWIRFPGQTAYQRGSSTPTVAADGTFTWQRQTGKKVYVAFTSGDTRSNRLVIRTA